LQNSLICRSSNDDKKKMYNVGPMSTSRLRTPPTSAACSPSVHVRSSATDRRRGCVSRRPSGAEVQRRRGISQDGVPALGPQVKVLKLLFFVTDEKDKYAGE
jgi:hypothetical protein